MTFRIVAFDRDGIGAAGTAYLMHKLDPEGQLVGAADMFAGNAMGAITALALANGVEIAEIMKFYRQNAEAMFGNNAENAKYCHQHMIAELGKLFGAARLSEMPRSGAKLMVSVERQSDPESNQWATIEIGNGRHDRFSEMLLSDLAAAACSAQGYFEPHILQPMDHPARGRFRTSQSSECNPSAAAMCYAEEHFGISQDEFEVLSIGLENEGRAQNDSQSGEGERSWAWPFSRITRSMFRKAGLHTVDSNCRVSALGEKYIRLQAQASKPCGFDDWQELSAVFDAIDKYCRTDEFSRARRRLRASWLPAKSAIPVPRRSLHQEFR
ncbi:hypothetical protein GRI43_03220 [Altererythrobacter luteolus]|uniref:PNPLA domain-containing protein n=1 Tax=Pontixanthobacter luteolus TaxID=295089 RepID=A0A6I4V212_9SPHN|nr:patatin-like phospholipase family protein [Pontixanthobacter luteolus]MXP46404.1 hypothetical protein [Pontixanthobacter luteolus]